MKALLQDVESLIKGSLYVKEIRTTGLNDQFHFHNVHEIALILKGTGKRIVGDNIEYFTDGDLVFMGPLLPHATFSGSSYHQTEADPEVHALVVYFRPDWFNKTFLNSPEFVRVMKLLKNVERGIQIVGSTKKRTVEALLKLKTCGSFERVLRLLEVLDIISRSNEFKYLASEAYSSTYARADVERLGEVYKYTMKNFTNVIKLSEVSSIANMTPTSFCKYFKTRTGKTFSCFVNELRIGQACKLLFDGSMSISEICYSCGFNNLTNFNKTFKNLTKLTPSEYRRNITLK